jgi:hypothetical protein
MGQVATADGHTEAGMSREEVDDAVRRWQEVSGYRRAAGPGGGTGSYRADDEARDEAGPPPPPKS